jgi:hypothetical protein
MEKPTPETRNRYHHFLTIPTRWMDNDAWPSFREGHFSAIR